MSFDTPDDLFAEFDLAPKAKKARIIAAEDEDENSTLVSVDVKGNSSPRNTTESNSEQAEQCQDVNQQQSFLQECVKSAEIAFPSVAKFLRRIIDNGSDFVTELASVLTEFDDLQPLKTKHNGSETKQLIASSNGVEISVFNGGVTITDAKRKFIESYLKSIIRIVFDEKGLPEIPTASENVFVIDSQHSESIDGHTPKFPAFESRFASTLSEGMSPAKDADDSEISTPTMTCFNCGGPHRLDDCAEKKDYSKIKRNRELMRQKSGVQPKSRYHKEKDEKFGQFRPGVISAALAEALNLHSDEVPGWIYGMRIMGYPPGYFSDLLTTKQGLVFYNDSGSVRDEKPMLLDPSNIIDYPGFNVPLPSNVLDEAPRYGFPTMTVHHSKALMEQYITNVNKERLAKSNNSGTGRHDTRSPTVEDLEQKRRKLLAELAAADKHSKDAEDTVIDLESASTEDIQDIIDLVSPGEADKPETSTPCSIPLEKVGDSANYGEPASPILLRSLSVADGTPVRHSLIKERPPLEKFAENITSFIAREEALPCMGGGYKKLKTLMSKRKLCG